MRDKLATEGRRELGTWTPQGRFEGGREERQGRCREAEARLRSSAAACEAASRQLRRRDFRWAVEKRKTRLDNTSQDGNFGGDGTLVVLPPVELGPALPPTPNEMGGKKKKGTTNRQPRTMSAERMIRAIGVLLPCLSVFTTVF